MGRAIRRLSDDDVAAALDVINAAATAYRGVVPEPFDREPYMRRPELVEALNEMQFYGAVGGRLVGVVGLQERADVSLVRHLYVRPGAQREGVGTALLEAALERAGSTTVLVGTWEAAGWAVAFYEQHGFELLGTDVELLSTYWDIPTAQLKASVVLRHER